VCKDFSERMTREFEMTMIGELNFFLGFQIKQLKEGTFIRQEKYTNDILKKFKMDDCKLTFIRQEKYTNDILKKYTNAY
jgi:hypothetical protein